MQITKLLKNHGLCAAILTLGLLTASAQTTATWIGPASGGEWNSGLNWDVGVPAEGTNAVISGGITVNYNAPMVATSFATLSLGGALAVNTNAFNINPGLTSVVPLTVNSGGNLTVNPNGVLTVANAAATSFAAGSGVTNNGAMIFTNAGAITLPNAASPVNILMLNAGSSLTMTNTADSVSLNVGSASSSSQGAVATLNGGTLTLDKLLNIQGTSSRLFVNSGILNCLGGSRVNEIGNDNAQRLAVNGGVANIGNFTVFRSTSAGGLVVSNGLVNATGIQIGIGNAASFGSIYGGVITNTGLFTISDTTNAATSSDRRSQFLVRGGTVVSTDVNGIILANKSHTNSAVAINNTVIGGVLDINAGTVIAEKISLIRDNTITNAYARLNLAGSGIIYLGSGGLVANVGPSRTAFNIAISGGTLAAKADWASTANAVMPLTGTLTIQAADAGGVAHSITLSNQLSGSGAVLVKTGAGSLILLATNSYTGNTLINAGTLSLGTTGAITNSAQIILTNGSIYDESGVAGASLGSAQVLSGQGSVVGSLTAPSGSSIRPGGNGLAGTLTFSNSFTESGNVVNNFDLSTNTTAGANDFINVVGDLNLSGTNSIVVNTLNGSLPASSIYKLIQYGGNFATGGITNLQLSGASGFLTNDAAAKTISLVISSGIRAATNVVWLGGLAANSWDLVTSSNWMNLGTGSRDYFVAGDNARFDDTGAANLTVNVVGSVLPGSMVVDSKSNYVFAGSGTIDGSGGLTKTNVGTLTISTLNNNYPGATIIGGGTIEVAKLAAGGSASSLGNASSDPANLQFFGTTLRYLGGNASIDRGATLNTGGATLDVATSTTTLTTSGSLVGPGGLIKSGPGNLILSGANTYSDVTTVSNGVLQINGSTTAALGTNAVNFAGGTLFLNVSGQPTYANGFNIVATSGLNVAGNNTLFTGAWSGSGTLNVNVNAGGFFTINSAMSPNFTGTIAMGNSGGLFRFNGGGGSPCTGSDYCTFDLGTSTNALINRNGTGLTYRLGALAGGPGTQLRGSENAGSSSIYQIGSNNLSTTFAGTIKTGNGGTGASAIIVKVGTGTLTLTGTNTYNGTTTISGGTLALSGSGSIGNTPTIALFTNTTLDVSGRTDGALNLNSGQTLQGSGTVLGSVVVRNGASLTVGDDANLPESMVVTNVLTLQSSATLNMDVDHYQYYGGRTNDLIQGLAQVQYGGTLNLNVLSIETNSVFKLFNAAGYSGSFASIAPATPPSLAGGPWAWDTSALTVDGSLRVIKARLAISSVDFSTLGTGTITLNAINGTPNGLVNVLTTTNLALPLGSWKINTTTTFDSNGNLNLPITVDSTLPQSYYLLQVQ